MNEISVLLVGNIEWATNGQILRASSTVTLVKTGEKNILIDTGSRRYKELLAIALEDQGLAFDDIDTIICTHHHGDHTGNIQHFKNAEILMHKEAAPPSRPVKLSRTCPASSVTTTPASRHITSAAPKS